MKNRKKECQENHSKKVLIFADHLLRKIEKLDCQGGKASDAGLVSFHPTIVPAMVGHTIAVHNGERHIHFYIPEQMVGHKLGGFSPTSDFSRYIESDKRSRR